MIDKIRSEKKINAIAFPDDGAEKRYKHLFEKELPGIEFIVCGKKRDENDPSKRAITIKEGDPNGKTVLIVDDLIQSGGTMTTCAQQLLQAGAKEMRGFCTHAVLPGIFT